MKATGIIRRADDLGRVVIPKEIRRRLRIKEGDPIEMHLGEDGSIILRKYMPVELDEIQQMAVQIEELAETLPAGSDLGRELYAAASTLEKARKKMEEPE